MSVETGIAKKVVVIAFSQDHVSPRMPTEACSVEGETDMYPPEGPIWELPCFNPALPPRIHNLASPEPMIGYRTITFYYYHSKFVTPWRVNTHTNPWDC